MAKATNLFTGTLSSAITASTTTIEINVGATTSSEASSCIPAAVSASSPAYMTIMPAVPTLGASNRLNSEVVKVTEFGVDGSTFKITATVVRAQKDTTAKAFNAGAIITNGIYADDTVFLSDAGTTETPTPWVGTTEIEDSAVTTAKIADEAVTTAKIADEAVTGAKIDFTNLFTQVGASSFTASAGTANGTLRYMVSADGKFGVIWGMAKSDGSTSAQTFTATTPFRPTTNTTISDAALIRFGFSPYALATQNIIVYTDGRLTIGFNAGWGSDAHTAYFPFAVIKLS